MSGRLSERREAACPLCGGGGPFGVLADAYGRRHLDCGGCGLIFVERGLLPSAERERARYEFHRNGPEDAGYVAFLSQSVEAARPVLREGMRGLDFGCGPSPVLAGLVRELGVECRNYDPYFFPVEPEGVFDVVFATEVVEHFHEPARDWGRMLGFVRDGGWLVVMTEPWEAGRDFAKWSYAADETHVCFYRRDTFKWIARTFGLGFQATENSRVFLFSKGAAMEL